jgi:PAS domain S-box-containing protein
MAGSHIGEYCYQVYRHGDTRCEECPVAESFKDGQIHTTERTLQSGEGTRYFEITSSPLKDETGAIIAGIEAVREITARKKADAALRERNTFIEAILDNLPIGLAVNSLKDGRAIYMNSKFEEIYGWPKDILLDVERFFNHVYPDPALRKSMKDRIMADMASGDPLRMRWDNVPITTRAGELKFVAALNIPLYEQDLMISTVLDVTARKKAEQAQFESEHRYKRLVESVTDYIYTVEVRDGSAAATIHGPGCVTVTGYTPEEYRADPDLWSRMIFGEDWGPVVEQVNKILAGVPVAPFEHRILHKDGSLHWVRNTPVLRHDNEGRLISYDAMVTDITPLKLLENQLRQSQKMEAVGQLAGGVAHDFNNILTAIIGYANLLLMKMPDRESGRAFVEQILSASERAAHLTHSLLAFSRKQIIDLRPVSLNEIISRVEKLLGRVIGEDIEFKTWLADADLPVLADSIQIEQVLMNLAANARDAMPDGGMLLIVTEPLELGEEFVRAHSYGKPGRYAYMAVTDTGVGMDEKTRNRIFEPFFTTKEVGKGTGLGLSMVYGIVKQHNGYITVDSEPGKGTTFKIYLPLVRPPAEEKNTKQPAAAARGTETVLLAEDDVAVRNLTRSVLEDFGYRVIEAADGEEAVRKFGENKGAVDLLVLDIIMPKKNGKEAYQEIRKIQPDIRALFTSGYTADIVHKKGILDTGLDFVLKPITPTEFLKKVREVLDRK